MPSRACTASAFAPSSAPRLCAHLGEQRCPYGLDIFDLGGLDDGLELVGLGELALVAQLRRGGPYGNVDTVIREDEGGVGGGKFGVGHFDVWVVERVS